MTSLVFHEDFSGDLSQWYHRGGDSAGSPDCVSLRKGRAVLRVKPPLEANIGTNFSFTYGYVEARMRFPATRIGSHGALWIQDVTPNELGGAEVDIAENFGRPDKIWHNVYWRDAQTQWPLAPLEVKKNTEVTATDWHIYGCQWSLTGYVFTIDEQAVARIRSGHSDSPKQVVLSMLTDTWETPTPPFGDYRMQVDWVKVWQ